VLKAVPACFKSKDYSKESICSHRAALRLLQKARQEGLLALESDVNDPEASPIYTKYPSVKDDVHLLEFINDYLRMMLSGNLNVLEIQELMDAELDTHHAEAAIPATAIQRIADAMPAFGIVAAVMGVVHDGLGRCAAQSARRDGRGRAGRYIPRHLLGYGFIGPLASLIEANSQEEAKKFECVKSVLLASMSGYSPTVAVEFGRKVVFSVDGRVSTNSRTPFARPRKNRQRRMVPRRRADPA